MAKNQIPVSKTLTQNMAAKARKKKIMLFLE